MKRSRVLGLALALLVSASTVAGTSAAAAPSTSAADPAPAAGPLAKPKPYRCEFDVFGHTKDGRVVFRRVVNARVETTRRTSAPVPWRPISWGLVISNGWPGRETTHQIVTATDGKVRLVETVWETGKNLRVRVVRVLGTGYPKRLLTFHDDSLYWVAADRSLRRATWNGRRLVRPVTLPVSIERGARAMTATMTDRGMRILYVDKAGALRVVADARAQSTDTELRASGYAQVTGLASSRCSTPNHRRGLTDVGLLAVNRSSGVARFQRVLRPGVALSSTVTKPVRLRRADWKWRRLG